MSLGTQIIYEPEPQTAGVRVSPSNPLPVYATGSNSKYNSAGDAFGRQRVSSPQTIFDSQQQYDKQPLLFDEKVVGGASSTHVPSESSTTLDVAADGDSIIRQTREYLRYQPGKSQLVMCTFVLGAPAAATKLVGYGDSDNGIFLGQDSLGLFVLLRSNATGTPSDARKVYQADWNVDTMDGAGFSGITIDPTKSQIFVIDLEWLGVGRVRVGFNVDGATYYVHQFLNANMLNVVYMTTANLPIRYEITSTGDAASLKQICCQVASEGGVEEGAAYPFASSARAAVALTATVVPLVAIRPALLFNSITNRIQIVLADLQYLVSGGEAAIELRYNPTLTGGTWGAVDAASAVEENITATAVSGGIVVARYLSGATNAGVTSGTQGLSKRLPFTLDIDGANPDLFVLCAYELSGNALITSSLGWREIR